MSCSIELEDNSEKETKIEKEEIKESHNDELDISILKEK
jgi:hypothetical protein